MRGNKVIEHFRSTLLNLKDSDGKYTKTSMRKLHNLCAELHKVNNIINQRQCVSPLLFNHSCVFTSPLNRFENRFNVIGSTFQNVCKCVKMVSNLASKVVSKPQRTSLYINHGKIRARGSKLSHLAMSLTTCTTNELSQLRAWVLNIAIPQLLGGRVHTQTPSLSLSLFLLKF